MAQDAGNAPPEAAAQQSSTNSAQAAAESVCEPAKLGSPFIPVDSWVYPAVWRLYALGYVDTVFLGLRPWTRASVAHMLEETAAHLQDADTNDPATQQAQEIYDALSHELGLDLQGPCGRYQGNSQLESVYTIFRGISGTPLNDSYHLGSTIINDYGRPFANGFNNYTGISGYATAWRFALYVRAEFQGAPSATGYSPALYQQLAAIDCTTNPLYSPSGSPCNGIAYPGQVTIPEGPIGSVAQVRFLEAYLSFQYWNNVFSFGKQDEWMGPAQGASFAYSNNAQNIYAFQINRVEPLNIPLVSRVTGPFRYEFLIGPLRGHTLMPNPLYPGTPNQPNVIAPGDPWVHVEKVNFRPTQNLEFGFERTAMFGGEGHSPVTIHTFLKSFFSLSAPQGPEKNGRDDPGARFGSFDFSYRLPYLRQWLTLYADGEVHDDVSPIDAPRRAAWRPGLYLSHVPGMPKLDVRVEAATTDPPSNGRTPGQLFYYEGIEKQGYTNQGQIFGDWIGRQAKGGQAWLTYHLSGNEWVQLGYRNQKVVHDFIPGGTTLNDFSVQAVKRIARDYEIKGSFAVEQWLAPIYLPGRQTVTNTNVQFTWYPERKASF
jgi:Capsule assembly protein Wzi